MSTKTENDQETIPGAIVHRITDHPLISRIQELPSHIGRGQPIGRHYISGSRISQYNRCEALYYYKYVRAKREPQNSALLFGTRLHAAQDVVLNALRTSATTPFDEHATFEQAKRVALDFTVPDNMIWKPAYKNAKTLDDEHSLGASLLEAIELCRPIWLATKPISAEQGYLLEWKDPTVPPVLGYSDFINAIGPNQAEVVDLKTGSPQSEDDLLLNPIMPAYAIMNELATGIPTRTISYLNLVRNKTPILKPVSVPLDPLAIVRLYRTILHLTTKIKDARFTPRDNSSVCGTCAFRDDCHRDFSSLEPLPMTA